MYEFYITDQKGRRYRITLGGGPNFRDYKSVISHPFSADIVFSRFSTDAFKTLAEEVFSSGAEFFIRNNHNTNMLFQSNANATSAYFFANKTQTFTPIEEIQQALTNGTLDIHEVSDNEQLDVDIAQATAGIAELRTRIRLALKTIVAEEQRQAKNIETVLSEYNALQRAGIYTGGFLTKLGSAAWDTAVWAKDVVEAVDPGLMRDRFIHSLINTPRDSQYLKNSTTTFLTAQKKEFVDVLGFDPTQISKEMFDEAVALAQLIWEDTALQNELVKFAKDYALAQHSLELTEFAGGAAFEVLLTIILAAFTGGVGAAASIGTKAKLVKKFKKVGDLFVEFAEKAKKIKLYKKNKGFGNKKASIKDFEVIDGSYSPESNSKPASSAQANKHANSQDSKKSIKTEESITELEPGNKGSWNKELNGELKPNHKYKVGDYLYETDGKGRVTKVSGKLDLSKRDRNTYQQTKAGKEGGIKDGLDADEGGHLVASIFDGPGEQINYAAMDGNLNKGAWKKMENTWADALKKEPPQTVEVEIRAIFDENSKRPTKFKVFYEIDGVEHVKTFKNAPGGN